MSRDGYFSFAQKGRPLFLALLVVASTFIVNTNAGPVGGRSISKRDIIYRNEMGLYDPFFKRDDVDPYSCSADRPCSNGACCGKDGWCGYAPEYCGDGCLANCDAKAECGEYAEVANASCPINVCCSEFGFCGTTEEFCGTGCQNGCEQPGPGAKWGGDVRDIVIGYYEAWTAGASGCGGSVIDDIPVQGLTHLFFSFGFIEPDTYNIIPMPGIAESVFTDVVNTKKRNPELKVYIALGGWTFNDNGTIWQPVFSDIVSTQAKRAKFISGLLSFLSEWGFDGVDFDWEYPGAGDRGGKEDDGVNFTTMLKELKAAIGSGVTNYGVTFTAPTSFWYLQHFDLEAMMQYVDWMNMMSYDLHGEWDAQNPIGARVLAHTNLTEINLALNLMWRNNVPPSQIVMGFGFYGRTFTLADSSCTQPGCAFVAGGAAGPCTNTAGYLSYKEIGQIIDSKSVFTTYDDVNAVKYFTYDSVNWVSFDDQVTLKQKVDFASNLGLRGLMIWAIDLDDEEHTALQSLLYPRTLDWAYSSNSTNPSGEPASSIAPTSTTSAVIPGATQAGIIASCNKYHLAEANEYCYLLLTTYGITATQFQAWNPATGSDTSGADCTLWYNYAYCVGISSSDATAGATAGANTSGATAGATAGANTSVASGATAGATAGANTSVASGATAGATGGANTSVASGATAGATSGAGTSVASGATAGATGGANTSVASGATAGATSGAGTSVASGATAGATSGAGTSEGSGAAAGGGASTSAGSGAAAGGGASTSAGSGAAAGGGGGTSVATGAAAGATSGAGTSVASGAAAGATSGAGTSVASGAAAGVTSGAGTSAGSGAAAGGASTSVATGAAAGGGASTSVATGAAAGATSAATTSAGTASTTSSGAIPAATQAGTVSNCSKWHVVVLGDYCYSVWQAYGITGAQFYQWNTGTGTDASGSDCSLWLNYAYCVGV